MSGYLEIAWQNDNQRTNIYPIHIPGIMVTEKTHKTYQGLVARTIAFEILKLPRKCEAEGCTHEGRVEVHHINKDRDDNRRENLRILCRKHHNAEHDVIKVAEVTPEQEILAQLPHDRRMKISTKSMIKKVRRRAETEKYREKWGIS
jgi:hypothetical protein